MQKFSYTVINQEGNQLDGIIEAENENSAREKLNKMEFSVLDITPISDLEEKKIIGKIVKYEFEAVDQNNKKVKGTIEAKDKYSAFKKLNQEYHLAVETLCKGAATIEEKEAEKQKGVIDLYTEFKREQTGQESDATTTAKKTLDDKEVQSKYIANQVDFVVKKVEELFKNFGEMIKPEEYENIEKRKDRLMRLKTSSNTDYIAHLSEDLLRYIQNQEIYIAQKASDAKIQAFNIEIKTMLSDIQRNKLGKTLKQDILGRIATWRNNNIVNSVRPSSVNKFLNQFFEFIEESLEEDPRLTEAKTKLRIVKQKLNDYNKIYKKEISEEVLNEMQETIKKLLYEKEQVESEIKSIQDKIKQERDSLEQDSFFNKAIDELTMLSGYLLAFYLMFYVVSEYIISKNMIENAESSIFTIQKSIQFNYITAILFITNITFTARNILFKKNLASAVLAFILILILSMLIIFNF
ncbi:MAG: hypothetical protein UT33_C0011G0091 [Candidatus Peregrinibacteria bacterium GW2011_GWC2_39_14]|nr:MAG: hypothetical protein UT33_C0011G0091 [Candidatus Peregrinibacteria bacterium GW2011_GWC2_39_14]